MADSGACVQRIVKYFSEIFSENIFRLFRFDCEGFGGFLPPFYPEWVGILENAEIVDSPCLDYVDVGTKFIVVYDGEDEETTLTLVETAQFINSFNGFIIVT